jgi:hypothetical protein
MQFKLDALAFTGLGRDALHVYFGLGLFIVVRLLWRWRGGWILAWLSALALAAGVEWLDLRVYNESGALKPQADNWHDIWNTMFWPTVLVLVGRWLHPKAKAENNKAQPEISGNLADKGFEEPPTV